MAADNDDQFEDDLESFDDVSEDGELPAEETLSDEDWDSYEEQPGESDVPDDLVDDDQMQDEAAPAKKKSSSFNKILIGVAVLGGLGFVVMQMGGGGAPTAPVEQQAAAPGANPTAAPEPEVESAGLLSSPQGMAQLQHDIAKRAPTPAPAPEPVPEPVPQPQLKEVNDTPVPPMPTAVSAPEAAPATEQLPVPGAVPAPPVSPAPVAQVDTHMPSAQDVMLKKAEPAPAPALPDNSAALQEKQTQIDSLQAQIGTLEGTLKTLNEKTANDQATIAALEKKLAEKAAAASAPVVKAEPRAAEPVPTPASKPEPKILGSSEPESATPAASVKSQPMTTAKTEAAKPAAVTRVSSEWVLKGAQPGRAMVAKPGESEIKTIEVGQTLAGIGKITAIVYENGRWSVLGTKGRINQ